MIYTVCKFNFFISCAVNVYVYLSSSFFIAEINIDNEGDNAGGIVKDTSNTKANLENDVKPVNSVAKTQQVSEEYVDDFEEESSSGHFMAYFLTATVLCVAGYVIFHNKQKVSVHLIILLIVNYSHVLKY